MEECIFCKIAKGEGKAKIVYQNERVVAFEDIAPKAPVHILIIPKKHIGSINEVDNSDVELLGNLILAAKKIAEDMEVNHSGYRLIFNVGRDSGQAIDHIHLHLLGGKILGNIE